MCGQVVHCRLILEMPVKLASAFDRVFSVGRPFQLLCCLAAFSVQPVHAVRQPPVIVFNDDGGWSWFQDPRTLVTNGTLVIGSVAAGARDPDRRGNIEVATYDLSSGRKHLTVLHPKLAGEGNSQYDDHDAPAFLARPDGRILAVYARHAAENHFYYRISADPGNPTAWQPERTFTASASSQITYSNLLWLSAENGGKGRIYDFFRGLDGRNKPSYAWSDDLGETWKAGNVFIDVPASFPHRPYVKYAGNGVDTVHMFYTDGHPHEFKWNSNYHAYYRRGMLYKSDGSPICSLKQGLKAPEEGTRIFPGDAADIAWTSDIRLDGSGRPYVAYSVRKVPAGAPPTAAGEDHRYHYARWNGSQWVDHEIAYAGSCLYSSEMDYTGNITLDPGDPDTVYISTNVEPTSGEPLLSRVDGKRHYELFKGTTADGGASWAWTPVTTDSSADNLRPMVPEGSGDNAILLWLRGTYRAYTDYDLAVVGIIARRPEAASVP
jgi:hypothetical protein